MRWRSAPIMPALQLKQHCQRALATAGHAVIDVGTASDAPVDYPDFAEALAKVVTRRQSRARRAHLRQRRRRFGCGQ